MKQLTVGKIRGMSHLSDARGIFSIVACDQRGALKRMLAANEGHDPTYQAIVDIKLEIIGALGRDASGVLLDPEYGAGANIAARTLPGDTGLAVSLEQTGYEEREGDRLSRILEGWSVGKIKAMGASAVKLLVYFNPRRERAAERQIKLVKDVADACRLYDIPYLLECLVYPTRDGEDRSVFAAEKEDLVVESARILTEYDVDLYKVEFPVDITVNPDRDAWSDACARLTEACAAPWALLSAGVDFTTFAEQLQAACTSGASGFVCGRALWKEAVTTTPESARLSFIGSEMPKRLRRLTEIASNKGRLWHEAPSHAYTPESICPRGWYASYPEPV